MKKKAVLISLFIIPIVTYIFFASGVYNFAKLPTLTENIYFPNEMLTIDNKYVSTSNKITVLGFLGDDTESVKTAVFNLNEKIGKRFGDFNDFQLMMILTPEQKENAKKLRDDFSRYSNVERWHYVVLSKTEIQKIFNSLQSPLTLSSHYNTPYMFIIDKNQNLRGRSEDDEIGQRFSYDASSVAELSNIMVDDVKVILAEYRLALKKYNKNLNKNTDKKDK